jgi:tripartite-type tricarboxylate transporter receptor subunit TctC
MLRMLTIGCCLLVGIAAAVAQEWPQRTVRLVVSYPAGGGTDIVARVLAQKLGDALGHPFIVENKPGATGMIGAQLVARSEADGYTFLVSAGEIALSQYLIKDMTYDPVRDLTPVTLLAWTPFVLAAHPPFPASNITELVKLARSQRVEFSSPGTASIPHLIGEYINKLQSTKLLHIPYRGAAPAVSDAVAGHVKLTISGMPPIVRLLESGALKAIAVTSKRRSPIFPNIPAMAETAGFEEADFTNWFGLVARTGVRRPILDKLAKATVEALKDQKVQDVLAIQAAVPVGSTQSEFQDFVRSEATKYTTLFELTGVRGN